MKNLFKNLMLVAVAAMGFTACEQVNDDVNAGIDENTVTMTFVAGAPESRTSVSIEGNKAKYSWSEDDQVGFYYVNAEATDNKKKSSSKETVISGDGTATFAVDFKTIDGASAYNIGAFYPSGSWVNHVDTNPFNNVKVKIPAVQALIDGSFDPKADLMMSKPFMGVALSNDTDLALEFSRIAAIGKMNLKLDDMEEGEIINKVLFSFAEGTNFNGPVFLDLENGDYTLATEGTSNCVELSGKLAANAERTEIFFTCFPGEYSGEYTIVVTTDKATYSKTDTLSKALSFSAGNVLNFNATVGNREVKEVKVVYTLVTNVADLAVGDKVVIVANGYEVAMSTTQNGNNRGVVTVTKSDNTIADADGLQILTLEAGKTSGTFAFNTGSGYLYAASSSKNYLRTETTLSANSSWSIEITGAGVATVKAQGSSTRNWMRYNNSNNPKIFSCYNNGQDDICIYKLVGEYTPTVPSISYTVADASVAHDATSGEAAVEATNGDGWDFSATTEADWVDNLVYVYADSKISFDVDTNDAEESREATVTVKATKAGYDDVTVTFTITQGAKPAGGTEQPGEGGDDEPVLVEKTATLSFANKAQRTSFSTAQQIWKQNGIIFTNTKTNDSNNVADYANPVRCYQNSSITIEAPGEIKTITIDCSGLDNKYITPWGGTVTNKIVTITLEGTSNTYTISKLSAQARAYTISVTYMGEEE